MILPICVLLMLIAAICAHRKRPRAASGALLAAVLVLAIAGSGLIARLVLPAIQPPVGAPPLVWRQHNSIVLLGAGTMAPSAGSPPAVPFFGYGRIAAAAASYRACVAHSADCKIVVSGGDPQRHGATEASVYAGALQMLNVPNTDILLEPRSRNTWQNAQESVRLVRSDRLLVVVTSGFQLRRALLYFSHFRDGVQGTASDFLDPQWSFIPSSENVMMTDALLHEEIGILRYHVYNALGWNAPRTDKN